jgi:hypothetical protein
MSIEQTPSKTPAVPAPPPIWGELAPEGKPAPVVRFVLAARVVCYPTGELKRWEHIAGKPEVLLILAHKDCLKIEGRDLAGIREALDLGRCAEIRTTKNRGSADRPGPQVDRITLETN